VSARILHVSDLHTGTREDPAVERALAALVERTRPELLLASGDLTHRGRREQHERAARFLRGFGIPVLAVPGNHDIPYTPARFTRPYREFERFWQTTEPVHAAEAVHVVGLNSVRPWRQQSGRVREEQLRWAERRLAEAQEGALRIAMLHHHLIAAPWRSRKRPVARRNRVLRRLIEAGAELIVAGHVHQAALSERREFEVTSGDVRAAVVAIAPGLGQPRPNRLGEARGLHVYDAADDTISAATYIWRDDDWALTAQRVFPRGLGALSVAPATSTG
jgi:3',5'-cyclic AMP phosphodiesterase CpdA